MPILQNKSVLAAGRTVTYARPDASADRGQAVIVELYDHQTAELDTGEQVVLSALTLVATDEQWQPVAGLAERYLVSSYGKVVSLRYRRTGRHRLLQATGPARYPSVSLHDGEQVLQIGLNRLVAQHFLPPPVEARFTRLLPKDGNHLNLRADNLQWVDPGEWQDAAVREHLHRHGERNASSKLTAAQVAQIRTLAGQGHSKQALAAQFGVSRPTISYIVRRLIWRTV